MPNQGPTLLTANSFTQGWKAKKGYVNIVKCGLKMGWIFLIIDELFMDLLGLFLDNKLIVALSAGILSIFYGLFLSYRVLSNEKGDKKMNDISDAISEGAAAYMKRQYSVVAIIGVVIFAVLFYFLGIYDALGFAIGAIFSTIAGVVGMSIAGRSNIRTAQAAKKGLSSAFSLAFKDGAVTGLIVGGLALLSFSWFYLVL